MGATKVPVKANYDALELRRTRMIDLLDEMDVRNPIEAVEQAAGEKLWAEIESALTQARTKRPRKQGLDVRPG